MNAELNPKEEPAPANFADGLPPPRRHWAVAAVSLGAIVISINGSIASVALPTLARDLHVEPSAAVLVVTIYQLVLMMTVLPFSALGERFGYRATFNCGLALFVASTVLCFFVHSLWFLIVVRALQALGSAAVTSVNAAIVRAIYPLARLGRGLSLNTIIAASAGSFAPTVGGAILGMASWPWLFAAPAPFALLAILVGPRALPDGERRDQPYDVLGAVLCAATFGLLVCGLENSVHGHSLAMSVTLVAASVTLGFVFVRRELNQAEPVLPVDLLRVKKIALPCIGSLGAYVAMTLLTVTLPFRLQQHFNFTPIAAGAVLVPIALVSIVVAPLSGLLSDRISAGLLGGIGMAFGCVSMICLALLPTAPTHFDLVWRVGLCGFGFGMFFSPNARQIVGAAPRARAAAAGALFSTVRGAGQTLGATAVAALLALGIGMGPVPGFIAAGFALLAGISSVLTLVRPDQQHEFTRAA